LPVSTTPVVVTYTVTVNPADHLGDGKLTNSVTGTSPLDPQHPTGGPGPNGPAGCPSTPGCSTSSAIPAWTISKAASPAAPQPGDTVTYTLTIKNVGGVPLSAMSVLDDLSGVIDDGDFNNDAATSPATGTVTYAAPTLTWTGDLPAGNAVTVSYSVKLKPAGSLGDGNLDNAATGTAAMPDPTNPTGPAVTAPGPNGPDGCPAAPACATSYAIPAWTLNKTVDPAAPRPGQRVTYTVVIKNTGAVPLTDVSVVDDLTGVLDDANYDPTGSTATAGVVSYAAPNLTWTGDLPLGSTVTVTYRVIVHSSRALGDGVLLNAVTGTSHVNGPQGQPGPGPNGPDTCPGGQGCHTSTTIDTRSVGNEPAQPSTSLRPRHHPPQGPAYGCTAGDSDPGCRGERHGRLIHKHHGRRH
jgi:uncharacterized repeat protein (TIGR01451 family)